LISKFEKIKMLQSLSRHQKRMLESPLRKTLIMKKKKMQ